jgi:hypothetical protein
MVDPRVRLLALTTTFFGVGWGTESSQDQPARTDEPAERAPFGLEVVDPPWRERSFHTHDPSCNPLCFAQKVHRFSAPSREALSWHGDKAPRSECRRVATSA